MKIYQIYYSEKTKSSNDSGFLQLDNLGNDRPDWREYWPIRKYFLENTLEENTFYGFLSPKFKDKTGLSSNPEMNWLISEIANKSILSFSDAHSPAKLGRELTIFEGKKSNFDYFDLLAALKNQGDFRLPAGFESSIIKAKEKIVLLF
jgi:hypothetical protein